MPDFTAKGVPYADPADPNDLTLHTQGLADWIDARPGVSALSTAQRDALVGAELWDGRVILNLTTGLLEKYDAAATVWRPASVSDHGDLAGLTDDDHPQYLTTARHDTTARHGAAVVDHGSIGGLGDDDHPQYAKADGSRGNFAAPAHLHDDRYYTEAEADNLLAGKSNTGHTHDHGALTGRADDDHPQYALADGSRGEFGATLLASRTITAAENVGLVTFSNVPQNYRDLELRITNISHKSTGNLYVGMTVNGAVSGGTNVWLWNPESGSNATQSAFLFMNVLTDGTGTSRGWIAARFPSYKSSSLVCDALLASHALYPQRDRGALQEVSPGLTQINLYALDGSKWFNTGTRFELWGVK